MRDENSCNDDVLCLGDFLWIKEVLSGFEDILFLEYVVLLIFGGGVFFDRFFLIGLGVDVLVDLLRMVWRR